MSQYSFNAREVEPDQGIGDPLPEAWYNLVILKAPEFGPNNKQTGTQIAAEFTVADGIYKGRKIFHNFSMENPSEQNVKIGKAQLSALSYALGILQWSATEQLMNIVFIGKVAIEGAQNGYPAKNKVTAFKHINDPSAGKVGTVPPVQQNRPAPPPAAVVPPPQQAWTPPAQQAPAYAPPPAQAAPAPNPNLAPPPPAWTPPAAPQAWEQPAPPAQPPAWTPPPQQAAPAPQPAYVPPAQPAYAPPPAAAPAPQAPPPQFAPPQAPVADAPPPWAQPQAPQQ